MTKIPGGIVIDDDINAAFSKTAGSETDAAAERIGASGMTFQRLSGAAQAVQGFAQMASAYAGYTQTGIQADWLKLQADQVGIQAEQKANILRENLYGMISNAMAGYAARGVDVGSGTPMRQAELSLKEGGKDIQQIKRNAEMGASTLRAQAKILKAGARAGMVGGMLSGVSSVLSGAATALGGGK
jgi:hypothetical protein